MAGTWNDIIHDALTEIGVKEPGEALDADERADSFRRLQGMLDEWGLEALLVPGLQTITHTITSETAGQTLTFGPADADPAPDIETTVTMEEIEALNYQRKGNEYGRPLSPASYYILSELRSPWRYWPVRYHFEASYPVAKLWFDANTEAGDFIEITGRGHFSSGIEIDDDPSETLPMGYREAVMLNLAVKLGPSYGAKGGRDATVSADTRMAAARAKGLIKARNLQLIEAGTDPALLNHGTGLLDRRGYGRW